MCEHCDRNAAIVSAATDLFGEVSSRHDLLCQGHPVVLQEHNL